MTAATLDGKRVLVVGASAGIGRAFALAAVKAGARVAVSARRADRLAEIVEEAGGGVAVAGDVCNPEDCERIAAETAAALGGIDVVLSSVGYARLQRLLDATADDWRVVLETNVIGINQMIRAAVPSMSDGGIVAVLSSEAVGQGRSALGAYGASKAALEESLRGWRVEYPRVRFSCIAVGATVPTEFGDAFEPELLMTALKDWAVHGMAQQDFMAADEVGAIIAGLLGIALAYPGIGIEHTVLRSPSPVVGSADFMIQHAFGDTPP